MKRGEFGRIEEAAGVQAVYRKEVPPLGSADCDIEIGTDGAKRTVGGREASGRLHHAQARARGRLDYQASLIAKFRRRSTGNDFQRLHGVGGNLIGEDLALLVGDGL